MQAGDSSHMNVFSEETAMLKMYLIHMIPVIQNTAMSTEANFKKEQSSLM